MIGLVRQSADKAFLSGLMPPICSEKAMEKLVKYQLKRTVAKPF